MGPTTTTTTTTTTTYHIPHTTYHIPRCIALNIHGKTEHVQPALLYNYNLCGLCWKIFLNILVLNIHGKTEHIGRNLNVKIVTRLLILVKILKFNMRAKHIRPSYIFAIKNFLDIRCG